MPISNPESKSSAELIRDAYDREHGEPYFGKFYDFDEDLMLSLRLEAELDDPQAQLSLGARYESGNLLFPRNLRKARFWYRRAAAQGNTEAMRFLGFMYEAGTGVRKDYAEAVRWYRQAADLGDPGGQYMLATMYLLGWGVPKDRNEAVRRYQIAALNGCEFAIKRLASLAKEKGK